MFLLTEGFRHALAVGLLVATVAVVLTLFGLVITRLLDERRFRLRQRLNARCQPLILAIMKPDAPNSARLRLVAEGRAHPDVVSDLVLKTLEVATGPAVPALRGVTEELGMVRRWSAGLRDRRWWVRAESARALGLVRETSVIASLTSALDDDHEEVRAAAVEALGSIGDPRCIPDLLRRLSEETRHQRARVVEALRQLGEAVTPALVAHVRHRPSDTAIAADLIGLIGGAAALDDLIEWTANRRAHVRAAAVRALGTIGLDDRAFYHVLRALGDEHPEVRAMAARARPEPSVRRGALPGCPPRRRVGRRRAFCDGASRPRQRRARVSRRAQRRHRSGRRDRKADAVGMRCADDGGHRCLNSC